MVDRSREVEQTLDQTASAPQPTAESAAVGTKGMEGAHKEAPTPIPQEKVTQAANIKPVTKEDVAILNANPALVKQVLESDTIRKDSLKQALNKGLETGDFSHLTDNQGKAVVPMIQKLGAEVPALAKDKTPEPEAVKPAPAQSEARTQNVAALNSNVEHVKAVLEMKTGERPVIYAQGLRTELEKGVQAGNFDHLVENHARAAVEALRKNVPEIANSLPAAQEKAPKAPGVQAQNLSAVSGNPEAVRELLDMKVDDKPVIFSPKLREQLTQGLETGNFDHMSPTMSKAAVEALRTHIPAEKLQSPLPEVQEKAPAPEPLAKRDNDLRTQNVTALNGNVPAVRELLDMKVDDKPVIFSPKLREELTKGLEAGNFDHLSDSHARGTVDALRTHVSEDKILAALPEAAPRPEPRQAMNFQEKVAHEIETHERFDKAVVNMPALQESVAKALKENESVAKSLVYGVRFKDDEGKFIYPGPVTPRFAIQYADATVQKFPTASPVKAYMDAIAQRDVVALKDYADSRRVPMVFTGIKGNAFAPSAEQSKQHEATKKVETDPIGRVAEGKINEAIGRDPEMNTFPEAIRTKIQTTGISSLNMADHNSLKELGVITYPEKGRTFEKGGVTTPVDKALSDDVVALATTRGAISADVYQSLNKDTKAVIGHIRTGEDYKITNRIVDDLVSKGAMTRPELAQV